MNSMFLSDLQEKEIISIETGLNYGHIVDCEIDDILKSGISYAGI